MSDPTICIEAVNKRFGRTHAVRDLNLQVPAGSRCGFLGPNGAGKSTTIRMIMSIIYPDSGSIRVFGGNALRSKDRIGYLPEERGVYRKMRVGEFLEYIARLKGVDAHGLRRRIQDWLERMELPEVYRKRCQELSKGMQQKVQFVAAVAHDPELLIFDEPFSGLDPVNVALINRCIGELSAQGKTIIFSTHVLHQAEQICDRIFLINHGVKLLDASMEEIQRRFDPRTIAVEPLDPSMDLRHVPGVTAVRPGAGRNTVEVEVADQADPQEIMRAVVELGPVQSIELRRPTLEEVFVKMVMRDEGEEAAARAREELVHA